MPADALIEAMDAIGSTGTPDSTRLRLSGAWTRFARTGDPNGGDLPRWPDYDALRRPTMRLDTEPRVADGAERRLRAAGDVLPPFHP